MTDGLWRKDVQKEEKPKSKYNFNREVSKSVATQYPAPNGKMYLNSTEYYRSLDDK